MEHFATELLEKIAQCPAGQVICSIHGPSFAELARELITARREAAKAKDQVKTLNQALQGCREMLADAVHQGQLLSDSFEAHMELTETELDPDDEAIRALAAKRLAVWKKAGLTHGLNDPLDDPINVVTFALAFGALVANDAKADYLAAAYGPTGEAPTTGILITHSAKATAVLQAAMKKIDSYNAAHDHPKRSFARKDQRQAS